jgi:hypothetical protein
MITNLTGEDLVKIIRTCKSARVSRLKLGELDVKFGDFKEIDPEPIMPVEEVKQLTLDLGTGEGDSGKQALIEKMINQEIEDANLILEDPTRWEKQATSQNDGAE